MAIEVYGWRRSLLAVSLLAGLVALACIPRSAQAVRVPGVAQALDPQASESFDAPDWAYTYNDPKATTDSPGGVANAPGGLSNKGYVGKDGVFRPRIIEDTFRGHPDVVERTTNHVAVGAGALRLATQYHGISPYDAVSWQHRHAATDQPYIPSSLHPSATLYVHIPAPSTWQPANFRPLLLMGMVGGESFDKAWPYASVAEDAENPGRYTWIFRLGGDTETDPRVEVTYLDDPRLEITEEGWWTVGTSIESNSLDWFVCKGLGPLEMSHHVGTRRAGQITEVYGLPGNTLWVDSLDEAEMSPDWIVDELRFYHRPRDIRGLHFFLR